MKLFSLLLTILTFTQITAQKEMYDICPIKNSEKIPKAAVYDLEGNAVELSNYIADKSAVLVFYRGGWCPFCMRHLAELGQSKSQIESLGFEIIGITPDDFSNLEVSIEKGGEVDYKLFSDKDVNAINAFGIGWKINDKLYEKYKNEYQMDTEWWTKAKHHVLPVPSVFVVDQGKIKYQYVNPDYSVRLSSEVLLEQLKEIQSNKEKNTSVSKQESEGSSESIISAVLAIGKAFKNKDFNLMKDALSDEFSIVQFKGNHIAAIVPQILAQQAALKTLEIEQIVKNEATVKYSFEGEENTSKILFDDAGKVLKIEYFDNLIAKATKGQAPPPRQEIDPKLTKKDKSVDVEFTSLDGLPISGKLYEINKKAPVILLCHQANYNKFEYNAIALNLNERGYNCLAIDQRSGGSMESADGQTFDNETKKRALEAKKATEYVDAEQDILAAIKYLKKKYKGPLLLWGSSYSSALALYIAVENKDVDAVLSFSPGDYLAQKKGTLADKIPLIKVPFFLTTSKAEAPAVKNILKKTSLKENQVFFIPNQAGFHGSKALWPNQKGAEEYWNAVDQFLENTKKLLPN